MDADNTDNNNAKRKSLGTIPISKLESQKVWKAYWMSAQEFSRAKAASSANKQAVKELLKKHIPSLKNVTELEFFVQADNTSISLYEVFKTPRKSRATAELDFRE